MSHKDVIRKFATRQVNKRTNKVTWSGHNVYCKEFFLYSYGPHFPIAKYLGQQNDRPLARAIFVTISDETSRHQGVTAEYCFGPSVPRMSLYNKTKIEFEKIKLKHIVAWRPAQYFCVYLHRGYHTYHLQEDNSVWVPPDLGQFIPYKKRDKITLLHRGVWKIKEAIILQYRQKQYFCSDDKNGPFVRFVPKKTDDLENASFQTSFGNLQLDF